jgi:ribokinase
VTRPTIAVSGSVHMDLIAAAKRLPQPGENMPGSRFSMHAGGKGGNQAIAAARMGARACMIARLGDDVFGRDLRATLERAGVDCAAVATDPAAATGASTVLVGDGGEYFSIIVPGAAANLAPADLDAAASILAEAAVTMLQLELPTAITLEVARRARAAGSQVMLNFSPVPEQIDADLADLVASATLLLLNEVELGMLVGDRALALADAVAAVRARTGVATIVVTLGRRGVYALAADGALTLPAHAVEAIDTVGAGDAFAGALAVELALGHDLAAALRIANAAGALAVTRAGAASALPDRAEVDAFLAARNA